MPDVKKDGIDLGTTLILLGIISVGVLTLPLTIALLAFSMMSTYSGLVTGCLSLDTSLAILYWYNLISGAIVFATSTVIALCYAMAMSKWLSFLW